MHRSCWPTQNKLRGILGDFLLNFIGWVGWLVGVHFVLISLFLFGFFFFNLSLVGLVCFGFLILFFNKEKFGWIGRWEGSDRC